MKNLISTIALVSMMVFSMSSFANTANPFKFASAPTIIDSYIQATSLGNAKNSQYLFAEDFKQIQASNNSNKQYTKKEVMTFLKQQEGYVQNCETSYKIIEQNKDYSVAKVVMAYPTFTRIDYVTLCNSKDAWEITQVVTSYDNNKK
ncbi:nuclear transport factor 2 family protein [Sphingobacterium hungaricum]|uniref:Lumazine-binding n=1 Tax=Sphingobacterium hungaricum TaxID=2082723 RepID=A0A928YSP5_9SPHI|nr:nuclear transport factor 2 family protein [Sphingobacterium hungaricum]MBE8714448.1 hypothetical protein [Sphingobacterium hungaricum]